MKLIELKNLFDVDGGAPEPIVLAADDKLFVGFYGDKIENPIHSNTDDLSTITVKFSGCVKHLFGIPSNETLLGHRYYRLGLRSYGFYELENSDLINELITVEKNHEYYDHERWKKYKHYIITFHDNIFECVAKEFEVMGNHDFYKKAQSLLK